MKLRDVHLLVLVTTVSLGLTAPAQAARGISVSNPPSPTITHPVMPTIDQYAASGVITCELSDTVQIVYVMKNSGQLTSSYSVQTSGTARNWSAASTPGVGHAAGNFNVGGKAVIRDSMSMDHIVTAAGPLIAH